MSRNLFTIAIVGLLATQAGAAELVELKVFPKEVSLTTKRDFQSVVVQGLYSDGLTQDLTDQAQWKFANEAFATRKGAILLPKADGETQLAVTVAGKTVQVPVKVTQAAVDRPVSFKLDVMPILTKSGCNTGSCHGAASGKDGFRLSLFGYDPDGDLFRITRELPGRRVDLSVPHASLFVEKSVGAVPHTGGKRFEADSKLNDIMVEWIANGTPTDPADQATCTSVEMYPAQAVLNGTGEKQRLVVIANYSDGTTRDVTSLAAFTTSNDTSAGANDVGLITAGERGEAFIMARFDIHSIGGQFLTLPKGLKYEQRPFEPVNYIDELVAAKLQKIRLHPSELCSDEEFLRRIYIDMVGLTPTFDEYTAFMADSDANKRAKKVDELLNRKEFTEVWVSKWAEWLMMRSSNQVSQKSIFLYYQWLVAQIGDNVPMDQMVRDILSSSGGTFTTPQTNFYEIERDQLKVAENVAQIFMGMRIQCAQCHNHPFDRWTQNDYYNFAGFFSQVGRKRGEDYREQIIYNRGSGEVKHPVTGQNSPPIFLGGATPDTKGKDRRVILANWLASAENPFFAKNFSNRIWHHFFGIGIVEPIDDVRISNPPSNPDLLEALAKKLTTDNYDMRKLIRDICTSKTYQRSTRRNESNSSDESNFAHQNIRRIKAESMLDIISFVTGTKDDFAKLPVGARAVQIADGTTSTYFLTTFGRAKRETACSCEVKMEPTLSQALHLMNGDTVNTKMKQGGLVKKRLAEKLTPAQIVERFYVETVSRKPTPEEVAALAPLYAEGTNVEQGLEDAFWALLNSREFLFNH